MDTSKMYEKLGLLYLGREIDADGLSRSSAPFLFRNRDLTTHGIIVGMTGSGKTGLGISLIEEAIMDNVPSIIIDPKGDMANLLLTFPKLEPEDFREWIDPREAAAKKLSVDAYAEITAKTWQEGLADWDQDKGRIASLVSKTTMTVYTPGSSAGVPVSVLSNFDVPAKEVLDDTDTISSLVNSTTASLLALAGVSADPLQSREHILISTILLHAWRAENNLSMEQLIGAIVSPPFQKVGVFPLDTFFPQSERMKLAMSLNNILASPGFGAWLEGAPLDIQRILYGDDGHPRTAIFSIAHLSDPERMFFVTMLLNRFVGWMRRQQGSSSLKCLLYMDEIFGYFPPTANPPSKKPMLLLLKQARAYGCGVVLATQNPVDLDYKGLANIGTWFVGRLQTTQDQNRVAKGIAGASSGRLDENDVKELLYKLKGRQFLLNSVHINEPVLFETRWVMSFLKGPVSAEDISKLMEVLKSSAESDRGTVLSRSSSPEREPDELVSPPPVLSTKIEQLYFLQNISSDKVRFEPWLAVSAKVRFYNASRNIDELRNISGRLFLDERFKRTEWRLAEDIPYGLDDCLENPPVESSFASLPASICSMKDLKPFAKEYSDYLYQTRSLELFRCRDPKLESRPNEAYGDFKVRLGDILREKKDSSIEKMRQKYATRQKSLEGRLNRAVQKLEREEQDVVARTTDTLLSIGVAVVGALFGRKTISAGNVSRAARGGRGVGRVAKEKGDVQRAKDEVERLEIELEELAAIFKQEMDECGGSFDVEQCDIETFSIKPRRNDIYDVKVCLLWEMVV